MTDNRTDDQLWADALKAIREGKPSPQAKAAGKRREKADDIARRIHR
jgi:hypothetical protein